MTTLTLDLREQIAATMAKFGDRFKTEEDLLKYALGLAEEATQDEQSALRELAGHLKAGLNAPEAEFKALPAIDELEARYLHKA